MAYVQPRGTSHDLAAAALRQGTRFLAIAAYAVAVAAAFLLLSPVLPKAATGIFAQLNWDGPMTLDEAVWGKLPDGHQLGKPVPLFPRIEA